MSRHRPLHDKIRRYESKYRMCFAAKCMSIEGRIQARYTDFDLPFAIACERMHALRMATTCLSKT